MVDGCESEDPVPSEIDFYTTILENVLQIVQLAARSAFNDLLATQKPQHF